MRAKEIIHAKDNYIRELQDAIRELHLTVKQLDDMRVLGKPVKEWPTNLYCRVSASLDEIRG
jgi:hypothetical protein